MADKKTIAIINHDPVFLRLVDQIMKAGGYDSIACPTGTSAHDTVKQMQPDLIMIDSWLATRDEGWLVLQTLRLDETTRGIPILLTTSDPEEVKRRSFEVRAMTNMVILPKPFDPESLLDAIALILDDEWNANNNASFFSPPQ